MPGGTGYLQATIGWVIVMIRTRGGALRSIRRGIGLVVLGAVTALIAIGCGGGGDSGGGGGGGETPTAKIVSDLPRQGANRAQTTTMVNAINLALDERNGKAGNIKIEYESLDDATAQAGQWDAAKCAENAQSAAQDDEIIGWIGPFNSGCAAVEIPILNEAGLAMISPANTYTGLTKPTPDESEPDKYYPTGERNYARVIVTDVQQGQAGAAFMEDEGVETVYILDDRETYGKGVADEFQTAAEDLGIEVIGREGIDGSAPNYRSLMNKIAADNPDAIYFGGIIENNAAQLIKDKVGAGMSNEEVIFVGPDGIFVDELIIQGGNAVEGIYTSFGGIPPEKLGSAGQEFIDKYEENYDDDVQPYTAYAYEAANVMLDAIERASEKAGGDVPDREAVIEEVFATQDYQGVLGTWSFDEDGDTSLTRLSIQEIEDGEFRLNRILDVEDMP
jgi:branched-chain amino acid transport system substrate-binding protein